MKNIKTISLLIGIIGFHSSFSQINSSILSDKVFNEFYDAVTSDNTEKAIDLLT
jgi:hypothetical protein